MVPPTILDLTTLLPGAYCTRLLVQTGWRVIKLEPPGGDILRTLDPELYEAANAGKEIEQVDLKRDAGHARFEAVLKEADALVESFRPQAAAKLGLAPAALWRVRDPLVVASLRGYPDGPLADRPGHDINYMAAAGAAAVAVDRDGRPVYWGVQVSNFAAGMACAFAIQAALLTPGSPRRAHIEIDLMSVVQSWHLPRALAARRARDTDAFRTFVAPPGYGFYETSDHQLVSLGVREPKFQRQLAAALGLDGLASHAAVAAAVGRRPAAEIERAFAAHDVPYAWVADAAAMLAEPPSGVLAGLEQGGRWRLGLGGLERWVGRTPA